MPIADVLLDIKEVSKSFPIYSGVIRQTTGSVTALERVSLQVHRGEKLAIVGGSGCGKSTLAKVVCGLLRQDSGTVLWEGKSLDLLSRKERACRVQMVFQDPYASLNPKLSIGTQLEEVLRLSASGERPEALLESVGLSADLLTHYPFQFSGGQRQRIAIARALAIRPKLLIADEPLSALDVTTQAQILDLLRGLQKSLDLTLLLITHDLAVADTFADRIAVLQGGRVLEEGRTQDVLRSPRQAYTKALVAAVPKIPW
jgi:peptide/nickel transport system ATP-binding protein